MASKEEPTVSRATANTTTVPVSEDESDAITRTDDFDTDPQKPPLETPGVQKVERFSHVLYHSGKNGRLLLYVLGVSIGLTMFGYALDQGITSQFTVIAASAFSRHADIGAVNTAASIIRAISKPFIGKLSDITSRPTTYVVVLVFYVIGFIVAATCKSIAGYIIGISFTAFGKSGLDLLRTPRQSLHHHRLHQRLHCGSYDSGSLALGIGNVRHHDASAFGTRYNDAIWRSTKG
jgi:hypothetical protein